MELKGIISISGRPGLFKIVSQGKSNVIVESILDKKRFPAFASEKISAVEDISIFTNDEDVKLTEIFSNLLEQQEGKEAINHKADEKELRQNFTTLVPNYDVDRVYLSDIRKVFQWYNLLLKEGLLAAESIVEATEGSTPESSKEVKKVKGDSVKKAKGSTIKEPKTPKPAVSKKAPVIKTGSSRGK
jgi:hypothetical protein